MTFKGGNFHVYVNLIPICLRKKESHHPNTEKNNRGIGHPLDKLWRDISILRSDSNYTQRASCFCGKVCTENNYTRRRVLHLQTCASFVAASISSEAHQLFTITVCWTLRVWCPSSYECLTKQYHVHGPQLSLYSDTKYLWVSSQEIDLFQASYGICAF